MRRLDNHVHRQHRYGRIGPSRPQHLHSSGSVEALPACVRYPWDTLWATQPRLASLSIKVVPCLATRLTCTWSPPLSTASRSPLSPHAARLPYTSPYGSLMASAIVKLAPIPYTPSQSSALPSPSRNRSRPRCQQTSHAHSATAPKM